MTANVIVDSITSVRTSPLGGAKHGSPGAITLCEIPFVPTFDLRVKPGTQEFSAVCESLGLRLPTSVGQTNERALGNGDHLSALCLGPDWWMIVCPITGEIDASQMLKPLREKFHFSIVDVSAQRTQIEVSGPRARRVLEHVWEQDLRETHFVIGACTQGLMAKAPVILWHKSQNCYKIFVRSSFSRHLWAVLADASTEYVDGA